MILALESTITSKLLCFHLIKIVELSSLPIVVPFALDIVIYGLVVDDLLDVQVRVLISLVINAINIFITRPGQETETIFILEKRSNKLFKKQPIFCFESIISTSGFTPDRALLAFSMISSALIW